MLAFTVTSSMYMNLGISIVCMVNSTTFDHPSKHVLINDQCPNVAHREEELGYTGTLMWSPMQQSQLFAAFFYASMLSMGFSGALADRFNPKLIAVGATFFYSFLSLISPFLANFHYYAFLSSRFLMGVSEGFVFPCITKIVSSWSPPNERASAAAIYTSGHQIASIASVLVSARLCSFHFLGGWPLIFYFFGLCGLFFGVAFLILISNSPNKNRFISAKEQIYLHQEMINEGLDKKHNEKRSAPWRSILTSPVMYSITACEISYQYSSSIFANFLPSFFRDVMRFEMSTNGLYASIPFIVQVVFKIFISITADKLKSKYGFSATASCKTLQTLSCLGTAIVLVAMGLWLDCTRPNLAMLLVILFGAIFSGEVAGSFTAVLFIAPAFTGTLSSLTALVGSLGGILAPTIFGLVNQTGTQNEYANFFFTGAAVNILAGLAFLFFGSAELQPWGVESATAKSKVSVICPDDQTPTDESMCKKF